MKNNTQVFDQALAMSPLEKAVLIDKLFQSFDQENQKAVDQVWASEAESRIEAYEAGKISARLSKPYSTIADHNVFCLKLLPISRPQQR